MDQDLHLNNDLEHIFSFTIELDKLKAVLRRTKPVGAGRYENSAEHSWQVALLARMLAPYAKEPVDIVRVMEMLLVHDIPEIDAEDEIVYRGPSEARAAAERAGAKRIFGLLPEPQATWCMERWEEYEARTSKEAIFARAMDRLVPVLQNLRTRGQSWRENKVPFEKVLDVNSVIGAACPAVWEYAQELLDHAAREGVFDHASEREAE